jgi:hypothetical protein
MQLMYLCNDILTVTVRMAFKRRSKRINQLFSFVN